jgi:hypothetical protein
LQILEYCEESELSTREKYYINLFSPEYNITKDSSISSMINPKDSAMPCFKAINNNNNNSMKVFQTNFNKPKGFCSLSCFTSASGRSFFVKGSSLIVNSIHESKALIVRPSYTTGLIPLSCIRVSSTKANENGIEKGSTLDPFFVTGFADGESSFYVKITKHNRYSTG